MARGRDSWLAQRGSGAACAVCGEDCEERAITVAMPSSATGFALIKNVPAEVCQNCGETRFSIGTAQQMVATMRGAEPPSDVIVVPIYDLARAAAVRA